MYVRSLEVVISVADNNWPVVVRNLTNVWVVWLCLTRIIIREGATPQVSRCFFKDVIHSVLLFGSETWVGTPHMGWFMGGVQGRGGETIHREAPAATDRWKMEINLGGSGKRGGGI